MPERSLSLLSMTLLCELCILRLSLADLILGSTKAWADSLDPKSVSGVSPFGIFLEPLSFSALLIHSIGPTLMPL
jgi:hypothetical protein